MNDAAPSPIGGTGKVVEADVTHVVPRQTMEASGRLMPVTPVLDTRITVAAKRRSVMELLGEILAHVFNVNTMGPLRVLESFSDHIAGSERNLAITITSGMVRSPTTRLAAPLPIAAPRRR